MGRECERNVWRGRGEERTLGEGLQDCIHKRLNYHHLVTTSVHIFLSTHTHAHTHTHPKPHPLLTCSNYHHIIHIVAQLLHTLSSAQYVSDSASISQFQANGYHFNISHAPTLCTYQHSHTHMHTEIGLVQGTAQVPSIDAPPKRGSYANTCRQKLHYADGQNPWRSQYQII